MTTELAARADAWFAGKGWSAFDFQRAAWAAYLGGKSGLINSSTGNGKTYAAWLGPVLEAACERERGAAPPTRLQALWITPLRALANDTTQSLALAASELGSGWRVEQRTGDTSAYARKRQREKPPAALVTTPESATLMLSYPDARERLGGLRAVIVDEWHELLGTKRGVQTELALARLREFNPGLRVWGLSATLGNLEEAMGALLGHAEGHEPGVMVRGGPRKTIEIETLIPANIERFPLVGHLGAKSLPMVLRALEAARTTLLFTNVRSQAEAWFQQITAARPAWLGEVAIHHGSIDREVREEVEDLLRRGRLRCVVCTSSLDLGVDYPAVDQVIQLGSPKGVARLLQRAGRSGHQPGGTSRLLGAPTHAFELVEFAAAREAAGEGRLESREPLTRRLDVLVQHLVTVGAGGGFTEEDLQREVRSTAAYAGLSDDEWRWCMDFVVRGGATLGAYDKYCRLRPVCDEHGVIPEGPTRWVVSSGEIEKRHRMAIGTIMGAASLSVVWQTGRVLGTMEEDFLSTLRPGDRFAFGGHVLEMVRIREGRAVVRKAPRGKGMVARWMGAKMPLSTRLAEAVRRKVDEAGRGVFEGPEMEAARFVLETQSRWSRTPLADELLVELSEQRDGFHAFLFPFEGRLAHHGLGALLAHRLAKAAPRSISTMANDYGLLLCASQPLDLGESEWREALSPERLAEDLLEAVESTEMARGAFREIARVAGLITIGYPGRPVRARQLQASSELFFDVFRQFEPRNLLLDQARREVLESQLEFRRLSAALERAAERRIVVVKPGRLTPLSFPIWSEFVQGQVSSETWRDRVGRMAMSLEEEATGVKAPAPDASKARKSRARKAVER